MVGLNKFRRYIYVSVKAWYVHLIGCLGYEPLKRT